MSVPCRSLESRRNTPPKSKGKTMNTTDIKTITLRPGTEDWDFTVTVARLTDGTYRTNIAAVLGGDYGSVPFNICPLFAVTGGYDRDVLYTAHPLSEIELTAIIAGSVAYQNAVSDFVSLNY